MFYNPNTLPVDGSCPDCGVPVSVGEHVEVYEAVERDVPWHFWVGVVAVVVYLGWRFLQGVFWLF
tara:strand:+ start:319 stop:513 length:195 start_codon:yes stop_codon:yes gene_type:complete